MIFYSSYFAKHHFPFRTYFHYLNLLNVSLEAANLSAVKSTVDEHRQGICNHPHGNKSAVFLHVDELDVYSGLDNLIIYGITEANDILRLCIYGFMA